jgi:hypothetical protein
LFLLLAAACALTMPSLHCAGRELPHPHAFFELRCAADDLPPGGQLVHDSSGAGFERIATTVRGRPDRPTIEQSSPPLESASALALVRATSASTLAEHEDSGAIPDRVWCPSGHLTVPDAPPPRSVNV